MPTIFIENTQESEMFKIIQIQDNGFTKYHGKDHDSLVWNAYEALNYHSFDLDHPQVKAESARLQERHGAENVSWVDAS